MEIVRQKCEELAYRYLMNKRGSKGSKIKYEEIRMSEYLLPNDEFNIKEQK